MLDARIGDIELQRRRLDAELAVTIAVAEQHQVYLADGHRTMQAYLQAKCSWSEPRANTWRSISRLVTQHLSVGDAFAAGRIGFDQAAALAKTHNNRRLQGRFGEFLPILLRAAEQLKFAEFQMVVKEFVAMGDADGAHADRDRAVEHRNAHACVNGSELDVSVVGGDPVTATEVVDIIQQFVDAEYAIDVAQRAAEFGDEAQSHPLSRTAGQRRFDAFVKLVRTAAINRTALDGGEPTPANTIVNLNIDQDTFEHLLAESGLAPNRSDINADLDGWLSDPENLERRRCETSDGVPVHPHDVLRALLHGYVRRVVVNSKGVVTDMGRLSRLYTGTAREAALLLLRFCQHPGCDLPASRSQVDHNIEWHQGGRTDQDNATVRCGYHNRWKHRNRWQTKQATNGYFYSIREDGTVVLPVG
ncbi:MAG TPA: DUF222 domain-containing protein, partial [Ilumatobacter sp.]|nr:DUF222 domain-containing protein [Ilumatobacter sp.]